MRNIKLTLEYDGTDFHGWQWQPTGRTVQGTLLKAAETLLQESPNLIAAGRTDAGVHALGQVVNFKTDSDLNLNSIQLGLNSFLPQDVVVLDACDVDERFHSRFDAVKRNYRYVISTRCRAIGRQFSWHCKYQLNLDAMREATELLLGEHSFKSFCKATEEEEHYLSHVESAVWRKGDDFFTFEISAKRFLRNMVRIIVGTLVDVGRGRLKPSEMKQILQAEDRNKSGGTAPASGLTLQAVYYCPS
ncbi:tRNA pseudouridine(38-40) synthase TruA [bacterium]|nr:tRNA pseudouridine(38-40) synthase TruA [bacterium]